MVLAQTGVPGPRSQQVRCGPLGKSLQQGKQRSLMSSCVSCPRLSCCSAASGSMPASLLQLPKDWPGGAHRASSSLPRYPNVPSYLSVPFCHGAVHREGKDWQEEDREIESERLLTGYFSTPRKAQFFPIGGGALSLTPMPQTQISHQH